MVTNKILPIALVAALLGGTAGAFIMRSGNNTVEPSTANKLNTTSPATDQATISPETLRAKGDQNYKAEDAALTDQTAANAPTNDEQEAYRQGFNDGFNARDNKASASNVFVTQPARASRVVYRPARTRSVSTNGSRRVYYDYNQPRSRTFWQKHRDKLTVAMGSGGGALIGALIGGKKGAAIGALAGGGGSALYTYKLRNRSRRY
ncbi:MAG: hypothetical protein WBP93_10600 [Pyrinomonadaceae bacterium]